MILNGIGDMIRKSDLSDRAITVTMKTIEDTERMPKEQFIAEFNAKKSEFMGALFDGVSEALKNINDVKLDKYPRMADFLRWIVAAEPSVFKKSGRLEKAYTNNIKNMSSF
jgi:putative DNA primase/helicase